MRRYAALTLAGGSSAVIALAILLVSWMAVVLGGLPETSCGEPSPGSGIPLPLIPIITAAAQRYDLGPEGPAILAAVTEVESGFGTNVGPSSAGAVGWTQFLPSTWKRYGVD